MTRQSPYVLDKKKIRAYVLATKAPILKLAEERQTRVVDANYEAIDLDAKVNVMDSLSECQKKQVITTTLKKSSQHCFQEDLEQLTLNQFT